MRVLVAYDGSDGADAALRDLGRAGLPNACGVIVISVAEQWLPPPPPSSYEVAEVAFAEGIIGGVIEANREAAQAVEDANALASQAAELVRRQFPSWSLHPESASGSPAREIIKKAEVWDADLVVIGPEGRSAIKRLTLGSVSQRVVTDAPCSVRVARPQDRGPGSPVKIIIGIDGSPGADAAVQAVAARNWPKGSEARLLTSVDPLHIYFATPEDKFAYARGAQQGAATKLREAGLEVSCEIKEADPKQYLIDEARRWEADSIFLGARGLGRIERFLLGSVSTAIVGRASCSVEVVRTRQVEK